MKPTLRLRFALLLLAALPLGRAAETVPSFPDYLAIDAIDYRAVVPPAPDETSFTAQVDQELAAQFATHRTPEQVALGKYYERLSVFKMLAPVLGDWATAETLPRTAVIFEQIRRAGRPAIEAAKQAWNRQRPFDFNPRIQPAVERPHNTSYPSGHSADSAIYAVVLAEIFPEHAADWQQQAALVRWSRLVAGAHYPNDIVAGRLLGEFIGRTMLKSPKLQADLEEVRRELRAAVAAQKKAA